MTGKRREMGVGKEEKMGILLVDDEQIRRSRGDKGEGDNRKAVADGC
jgi:hypothetical protein